MAFCATCRGGRVATNERVLPFRPSTACGAVSQELMESYAYVRLLTCVRSWSCAGLKSGRRYRAVEAYGMSTQSENPLNNNIFSIPGDSQTERLLHWQLYRKVEHLDCAIPGTSILKVAQKKIFVALGHTNVPGHVTGTQASSATSDNPA